MTKFIRNIVLALGLIVLVPSLFGQCQPAGAFTGVGPAYPNFDYVANGTPNSATCWSVTNATVGVASCGSNAFEFNYGGNVTQSFTIPTADTSFNTYQLEYTLDFQDPNHDGQWDGLTAQVWDRTANTLLESDSYNGSQPDLSCSRRILANVSGNRAGHTIEIEITGTRAYTNTHVGVSYIKFWGWTQ